VSGGLADRTVNPRLGDWLDGGEPVREVRDPLGWVEDALVAGLRMVEGVDLEELSARSGLEVGRLLAAEVDALVAEGLVSVAGGRLAATPRGMTVLDTVTARLVPLPPPPR
jgi:oxygen-independent coproporphyrinogen-3 oxidase